jgi:polysaccharide export outer membrane protein
VVSFRPFFILGEVNRPGNYPAATGMTLEQAVASAGGFTYRANTKKVYLKAATETQERLINLRESANIIIRAGDTVRVAERHF